MSCENSATQIARIAQKLSSLDKADPERGVFGSDAHRYELTPVLGPGQLDSVQNQLGVQLPANYATFLETIGTGGAGPFYGIFPLVSTDGKWQWLGDGSDMTVLDQLSEPFPYTQPWNLDGHIIWDSKPDEEDERFDSESFEEAEEAWCEEFYEIYWDPKWTVGAICLCHHGCALRSWLVVTGPERGNMWFDAMAETTGLEPHVDDEGNHLSFADWYERWLDKELTSISSSSGRS